MACETTAILPICLAVDYPRGIDAVAEASNSVLRACREQGVGFCYLFLGQREDFFRALAKSSKEFDQDDERYIRESHSKILAHCGYHQRALEALDIALSITGDSSHHDHADLLRQRVHRLINLKRYEEAVQGAEQLVGNCEPDSIELAEALDRLSMALRFAKNFQRAAAVKGEADAVWAIRVNAFSHRMMALRDMDSLVPSAIVEISLLDTVPDIDSEPMVSLDSSTPEMISTLQQEPETPPRHLGPINKPASNFMAAFLREIWDFQIRISLFNVTVFILLIFAAFGVLLLR
ncbi:hypothetical protein C8J56DRAFT_1021030 [Mycena floridula]|nr:hypothetical protein C8J56DRAFT_1021030 [Mycena floridula]